MQKIYVRRLVGAEMIFEIDSSHTVSDLKGKIEEKTGYPTDQQRLVFGDAQLPDDDGSLLDQINASQARRLKLADSDEIETIRATSSCIILTLVLRLRGGANEVYHRPSVQIQSSSSCSDQSSDSELDDKLSQRDYLTGKENKHLAGELSGEGTQIHIKTLTGHEIPVEIVCSDTLDDVKRKIFNKEGIDPDDQQLIFGECQLSDGVVLDQLADAVLGTETGPGGPWYYFDDTTGTAHVTLLMLKLRLKGGNAKSRGVQTQSGSFVCDTENRRDGDGNTASHAGQVQTSPPPRAESSGHNEHIRNGNKKKSAAWSWSSYGIKFARRRV